MDLFRENAVLGEDLKNSAYTRGLNTANYAQQADVNRYNRYGDLMGTGFNALGNQSTMGYNHMAKVADLRTGAASATAAGIMGAANAREQGVGNMISLAAMASGIPVPYGGAKPPGSVTPGSQNGGGLIPDYNW